VIIGDRFENPSMKWPRSQNYVHMKRPQAGPTKHERSTDKKLQEIKINEKEH